MIKFKKDSRFATNRHHVDMLPSGFNTCAQPQPNIRDLQPVNNRLHFIQDLRLVNQVTIHNEGIEPNANDFVEATQECPFIQSVICN